MNLRFHLLLSAVILPVVLANSPRAETKSIAYSHEVVLEATNEVSGNGYFERYLYVRVRQNGDVEWQEPGGGGKTHKIQLANIGLNRAANIQQRLGTLDMHRIPATSGPYEIYTDTGIRLVISVYTAQGKFRFDLQNPWLSGRPNRKPISKDLTEIICEANMVRARVAQEPIDPLCKSDSGRR